MRLLLLSLLALASCAHAKPEAIPLPPPYALTLGGPAGFGHGCPVSPMTLLTAQHVYLQEGNLAAREPSPLRWQDSGGKGTAFPRVKINGADLGLMEASDGEHFSTWFKIAERAPLTGSMLFIVGYDFRRKVFFAPVPYKFKYLGEAAGYLVADGDPLPGSSGGCILDDHSEVVGVVSTAIPTLDYPHGMVILGPSVYGEWLPAELLRKMEGERK